MALCLLQVYVRYSRLEEYSSSTYLLSDFNKLFDVYTAKRIGMSKVNLSRNQRNPGLNLKNYSFSIQLNAPVSTSYPHTLLCHAKDTKSGKALALPTNGFSCRKCDEKHTEVTIRPRGRCKA